MTCDVCHEECEELVTRQGFLTTFFVEWVCVGCYKKLNGADFGCKEENDLELLNE